ncbi:MAG: aminomethyl-transferring glycine dehydrogenase [Legionellales bacterium]|nr:aminomethyl-transferring glycine dehydrogenase [Legionellales bacterium]|tara:strand:- start:45046 stop:46410 length:1365 start_codon:yes stop_codon:yes gene_type:complete
MPFIPHTEDDVRAMLNTIGVDSINALFDEIPDNLRIHDLPDVPEGLGEMELAGIMRKRALQDIGNACYIGAGAYEHHIPAAVWEVTGRGEFMTAYTPYQAEASQGTLQLIYEYQTMISSLMGLDVSNASLYDGASAMGEAILMAVRANRQSKSKRILVAGTIHPVYRRVAHALVKGQHITIEELPFCPDSGITAMDALAPYNGEDIAAVVIPQPNFFGRLEEVDLLTNWGHEHGALVIAVVNPIAMSLFREPGQWGDTGADIAVGEGQPLGIPLASGGPYFGFMCCKQALVRQMPGRIIGRTTDLDGKPGFALTLQAREQHIRRSKATSNICTNQGLAVTAATIYMSIVGAGGLRQTALASHHNTKLLVEKVTAIKGVEVVFEGAYFHEVVLRLAKPVHEVMDKMAEHRIQVGYPLGDDFPDYQDCLLVCVTEKKDNDEIQQYADTLATVLGGA